MAAAIKAHSDYVLDVSKIITIILSCCQYFVL